jgi:uncharacterized RDD family membrane protein YckC
MRAKKVRAFCIVSLLVWLVIGVPSALIGTGMFGSPLFPPIERPNLGIWLIWGWPVLVLPMLLWAHLKLGSRNG